MRRGHGASRGCATPRRRPWRLLPFLALHGWSSCGADVTVVVGAFQEDGRFTLDNIRSSSQHAADGAVEERRAVGCAAPSVGAVFGAFLAYLIVIRRPTACSAAW